MALTMVLHSCGHGTYGWSQLYSSNPNFATTYQAVSNDTLVANFHLQDGSLCHFGHLFVPLRERLKLNWECHYGRVEGHFGVEKIVVVLQKYFYRPKL
jgi:hypothetical protein